MVLQLPYAQKCVIGETFGRQKPVKKENTKLEIATLVPIQIVDVRSR